NFKSLNDTYGHQVGDEVLRIVGRALLAAARPGDIVGRTGGDEFVVAFPGAGLAVATALAERLRRAIAESDLRTALGPGVLGGITASFGVAVRVAGDSIVTLVGRADRCLYAAKHQGRNRVVSEAQPDDPEEATPPLRAQAAG
ncbi:MAG TPA: GGDEF domain-containing protein, partial [Devosia sp.]|nr:GGDEF domain-containing protein [Devosia sp.]